MSCDLPPLDKDGYLLQLSSWSRDIGEQLARNENIELTQAHWEVIDTVQAFYQEFDLAPASRALVRYIQQKLGPEKGRSLYLLSLFPPHPALIIAKIAGLPRPANCF
ncbi:TusE/DsrC/DsvC family sulfur relay protein [Gilvimarinus agarilyticus]|uniref:TusE/DsrC/DsvC family sulfur relay protein n=1 Tax=unclassified Gilvimarinus TaxID=2642066 RepID=UPI001C09B0C1|nr:MULTISPECIES: TusE/DsrC/DsvC family sulfur relay protein [unclassified Gilvimarinus]MBU2887033.1 TusE/DsrC/DsvC family sulfur relay protein [Gilvimarinus agarilyticus]MDO6571693.1 TusE/DsrC/DsvC family sulfur relay protein [Gilvimarinus sp. 2_MG-2023]MDO6745765.1 TusE/DsrC/DsvC family sulfur relay protein [Gilvimarinus sp. 1_MG-2023]